MTILRPLGNHDIAYAGAVLSLTPAPFIFAYPRAFFRTMRAWAVTVGLYLIFAPVSCLATNTPCSGHKGGIDHCQGSTFICNDGSVSASKKSCEAYMGGASSLLGSTPAEMEPTTSAECSCQAGLFCVGPRGGHYCLTDDGRKIYLRK